MKLKTVWIFGFYCIKILSSQAPPGIDQGGNTCYQASVLQCLYNVKSFRDLSIQLFEDVDAVKDAKKHPHLAIGKDTVFYALGDLFSQMQRVQKAAGRSVTNTFCHRAWKTLDFSQGAQADASNFCSLLIQKLPKELQVFSHDRYGYPFFLHKTSFADILASFYLNNTVLIDCSRVVSFETTERYGFFIVSTIYPNTGYLENMRLGSTEEITEKFTRQPCSGGEPRSQRARTVSYNVNAPLVRIIHPISDRALVVRPFSLMNYGYGFGKSISYRLTGIVAATAPSGFHYVAFVKASDDEWYRCSDSSVTKMAADDVVKLMDGTLQNAYPTLLFHERIGEPVLPRQMSRQDLYGQLEQSGVDRTDFQSFCREKNITEQQVLDGFNQGICTLEYLVFDMEKTLGISWDLKKLNRQLWALCS